MVIQGLGRHQEHGRLTPTNGQSHGDHRVAMSIAIAGLTGSKEMMVHDTDCIETSFPGFPSHTSRFTEVVSVTAYRAQRERQSNLNDRRN